jgi:hypothetical protein
MNKHQRNFIADHAALEEARKAKDAAATSGNKAEYNRLRDLVDTLIYRMQCKGTLGTLDLEETVGPEEDQ